MLNCLSVVHLELIYERLIGPDAFSFVLKLSNNLNMSHLLFHSEFILRLTVLKMSLINAVCFIPRMTHFVVL